MMQGARGDVVLVNGTPDARVRVPAGLVRLRLLNASNAREYHLAFTDARAFQWIATDGGLLEAPVERRSLSLMPGERAEVVVDFSDGGEALLFTRPDGNLPMMGMMGGRPGAPLPVLAFEASAGTGAHRTLPRRLASHERPDPGRVERVRRFSLDMGMMGMGMGRGGRGGDMFSINGRSFDMGRIDERVRLGDTEIWEVAADMMAHPFHVHGVHFHVIGRGGGAAGPADAGLKDTVRVREPVRLLVRFTQPTRGRPYMYHCHILEHEDMGMMGQFTVG
jgi:FtsP/CotA-like multicopper oxidase with cupredoxin domain